MAGDTATAARRYEKLLKRRPDLAAARTGLAYARLRAGRLDEASSGFDAVLADRPDDLPALVGAASAAVRRGDADAALAFYRRAQAVAPEDALVRKRLAALRLQVTERHMGLAQAAVERGRRGDGDAGVHGGAGGGARGGRRAPGPRRPARLPRGRAGRPRRCWRPTPRATGRWRCVGPRLLMEQQEFARAAEVYRGPPGAGPGRRGGAGRGEAGSRGPGAALHARGVPAHPRGAPGHPRGPGGARRGPRAARCAARARASPAWRWTSAGPGPASTSRGSSPSGSWSPTRTTRSSPARPCAGWTWRGRPRARSTSWASPGAPLPPRPTCRPPTSTTRRSSACSRPGSWASRPRARSSRGGRCRAARRSSVVDGVARLVGP